MRWQFVCLAAGEVCLLSLRGGLSRTSDSGFVVEEQGAAKIDGPVYNMTQEIEGFAEKQLRSSDSCHSKVLESQRTLDGISSQVFSLTDRMERLHESEVEHTTNLRELLADKNRATKQYEEDAEICEAVPDSDLPEKYEAELEELRQIANPTVTSNISRVVDYGAEADKQVARIKEQISGLQWGDTQCKRFVNFLAKKTVVSEANPEYRAINCHSARFKLKGEYEIAYLEIYQLLDEAIERKGDSREQCFEAAEKDYDDAVNGLGERIRKATEAIAKARKALEGLRPLLRDSERISKKMVRHLEKLKEDCQVSGEVTEHLRKVRRLIQSLEDCPGRNDYVLELPTAT
jgi:hypothetical protein